MNNKVTMKIKELRAKGYVKRYTFRDNKLEVEHMRIATIHKLDDEVNCDSFTTDPTGKIIYLNNLNKVNASKDKESNKIVLSLYTFDLEGKQVLTMFDEYVWSRYSTYYDRASDFKKVANLIRKYREKQCL